MPESNDVADVLVIGAGASGAAVAWSLSQAGIKVVCLEQGGWLDPAAYPTVDLDYELHRQTDFNPDPNVRQLPSDYPVRNSESAITPLMHNAVGGSTIHWGAHFPRFHPSDFRVRTLDGVADDWPLSYQELEPYFDTNDRIMGVSGLSGDPANPLKPPRPMPPLGQGIFGDTIIRGFEKMGWHWWIADAAIASVPYDGREACNYCGPCDLGCTRRSKASVDITYWPKALQQGAVIKTQARVREISVDKQGLAQGAVYYDADGRLQEQKARAVVMACNGIGTPRLLLNSKSSLFPAGLANSSGLVGKNLMFHPAAMVTGVFEEPLQTYHGPYSNTIYSHQFYESDPGRDFIRGYHWEIVRGGAGPLSVAFGGRMGHGIPWGQAHHRVFQERFGHTVTILSIGEDLPDEGNQVLLDSELTDSSGIPAPRVVYKVSDNTRRMLEHGVERSKEVFAAAGAKDFIIDPQVRAAGWHLMGTARMGDDSSNSVVNRWGRAHDVPNLFIVDGSIFVTSAAVNPTPTIQALALRTADYMKREGPNLVAGLKAAYID